MSDNADKIATELCALGFETSFSTSSKGKVVSFVYEVEVGSHKNKRVRVGLSMQGSEPYPEYPPHWMHISPPIDDERGGAVEHYTDELGQSWIVLSRPPGDLWDRLPTKHIRYYLSDHLRSFWNTI